MDDAERDEYEQLLSRLSDLLTGTANALKGEPGPLKLHDWSDLPVVAEAVTAERDRLQGAADKLTETTTRDLHVLHRISTALGQRENLSETVYAVVRERDRLEADLDALTAYVKPIKAERDRLRAVVDGMPVLVERTVRALRQSVGRDLAADPDTIRDAVAAALAAIRSGEATDG